MDHPCAPQVDDRKKSTVVENPSCNLPKLISVPLREDPLAVFFYACSGRRIRKTLQKGIKRMDFVKKITESMGISCKKPLNFTR